MYYQHFGLSQPPFKITPDTRLFYPGCKRGAVLEALIYAITSGEGIVKVVGEVGSGKTMLCRMLEVELPKHVEVVYLANPSVSPDQVLHAIAFELKLSVTTADDRLRVMQILQDFLLRKHADNRRVVVFVEEAQAMPEATLEEIRLLSNLETSQEKLLQIVLFGQPELDLKLRRHDIRQLRERITYHFALEPFKTDDVRDYLNARLRASGLRTAEVFSPRAIRILSRASRGLVRRINILADKGLLAAYASGATSVSAAHLRTAVRDSEFETAPAPGRIWRWVLAGGLVAALLVGIGFRVPGPQDGNSAAGIAGAAKPAPLAAQPASPPAAVVAAAKASLVTAAYWPTLPETSVAPPAAAAPASPPVRQDAWAALEQPVLYFPTHRATADVAVARVAGVAAQRMTPPLLGASVELAQPVGGAALRRFAGLDAPPAH